MVRRWRWIKWDERKRIGSFWCSAFVDWKLEEETCVLLVLIIIHLVEHFGCSYSIFFADFSLLPYSSLHFIGSLSSLICWFHAADDDEEDDDVRQITHTRNLNQRWTPSAQVCFEFVYTYIILHMYLGLMYVSPFST